MACGGCRQKREFTPLQRPAVKTPCHTIAEAGDGLVVEVTTMGTLVPKGPYTSPGYGLGRALTILGCYGHNVKSLREIEITVMEILTDPTKSAKFYAALPSKMTTLSQIKKAIRSVQ